MGMNKSEESLPQYENEDDVRLAVERASRRSLTDDEWAAVAPTWVGPYGDADVAELVNVVRSDVPNRTPPTSDETAFKYRRAHQDLAVQRLLPRVQALREELFGSEVPPFPDLPDVAGPAMWIESHAEPISGQELTLTFSIPVSRNPIEALSLISSSLARELDEKNSQTGKTILQTSSRSWTNQKLLME